jgi:hypothetical protein
MLDFLNSDGEINQNVGGHFHHFGRFSSSTALAAQFVRVIDRVLSSDAMSTKSFILANFLQPLQTQ